MVFITKWNKSALLICVKLCRNLTTPSVAVFVPEHSGCRTTKLDYGRDRERVKYCGGFFWQLADCARNAAFDVVTL